MYGDVYGYRDLVYGDVSLTTQVLKVNARAFETYATAGVADSQLLAKALQARATCWRATAWTTTSS